MLDPRTRESRGFGFVTMDHLDDAERCIKYLNRSTLEGRMITVEKVSIRMVLGFRMLSLSTTNCCLHMLLVQFQLSHTVLMVSSF